MVNFSAEKVQEIVEEKEAQYKKLEEEYSCLKEYCEELKSENDELQVRHERYKKEIAILKRKCESYEEGSQTVWSIYNEDLKKMKDLHELNNKLVKSNKAANRDFFILAAAYVATLMLMIYLFIR
nr:MAG TPA: proteasome-activating nucleotidase [Caudoviricetes sp.]